VQAAGVTRALAALDPRSRRIVEARWLKEKDTATLHDLAAEFGISAERIRQIEAKAMQKMKKVLQTPAAPRLLPSAAA
jgi:RNA polymerase sigma-32 factor